LSRIFARRFAAEFAGCSSGCACVCLQADTGCVGAGLVIIHRWDPAERCFGLAQDAVGNIYLFGTTNSTNFPVTRGAWRTAIDTNLNDEFIVKLDARSGRIQ